MLDDIARPDPLCVTVSSCDIEPDLGASASSSCSIISFSPPTPPSPIPPASVDSSITVIDDENTAISYQEKNQSTCISNAAPTIQDPSFFRPLLQSHLDFRVPDNSNDLSHLNNIERHNNRNQDSNARLSQVYMWIGQRASNKQTWPGMLDNMH
ncbi:unnamed protein product [Protopolystoma xenopodis]|uniref:Uncharacterized protein n=1 Tax=Protopolystoma xenopodis TaxID=117903 RepID=A0A448X7D5_9PLAT|nr:unnamed protein product [Protopolystoma xenopodis]